MTIPRIGVVLPARGSFANGSAIVEVAVLAEQLGFASLWATDHIIFPQDIGRNYPHTSSGVPTWEHQNLWIEALVALAWAGSATSTIRLGTAVLVLPLRSPVVVAKQVASLDHLSDGRVVLGLGAGWLEYEFGAVGADFGARGQLLNEGIEVLRECFAGDLINLEGRGFSVDQGIMLPRPKQGATLPLLIGGHSAAALRRVARYGDGWIASQQSPSEIRQGLTSLENYAAEVGRGADEFQVFARLPTGSEVTLETAEEFRAAGVDELLVDVHSTAKDLETCLSRLRALSDCMGTNN